MSSSIGLVCRDEFMDTKIKNLLKSEAWPMITYAYRHTDCAHKLNHKITTTEKKYGFGWGTHCFILRCILGCTIEMNKKATAEREMSHKSFRTINTHAHTKKKTKNTLCAIHFKYRSSFLFSFALLLFFFGSLFCYFYSLSKFVSVQYRENRV